MFSDRLFPVLSKSIPSMYGQHSGRNFWLSPKIRKTSDLRLFFKKKLKNLSFKTALIFTSMQADCVFQFYKLGTGIGDYTFGFPLGRKEIPTGNFTYK